MPKIKIIAISIVVLILFAVDRLLKYFIIKNPAINWDFIFFKFSLWYNQGIAWGIELPQNLIIIASLLIIIIAIGYLLRNYKKIKNIDALFLIFIILGAVSNLLDRLLYGSVIDYINLSFWPVFNLADLMIIIGALGWLYSNLSGGKSTQ